jgi:hypothetical protein
MTTAALAIGGRLRPPFTTTTGVQVADATGGRVRRRFVVTIEPAADDALTELARVRFGGVKSRAADWCLLIGAAVLSDPSTFGAVDAAAALDAYCGAGDGIETG